MNFYRCEIRDMRRSGGAEEQGRYANLGMQDAVEGCVGEGIFEWEVERCY